MSDYITVASLLGIFSSTEIKMTKSIVTWQSLAREQYVSTEDTKICHGGGNMMFCKDPDFEPEATGASTSALPPHQLGSLTPSTSVSPSVLWGCC